MFLEAHLKLKIPALLSYMEKSVDGGAIGEYTSKSVRAHYINMILVSSAMLGAYKNDTQSTKGSLRTAMTESLRECLCHLCPYTPKQHVGRPCRYIDRR